MTKKKDVSGGGGPTAWTLSDEPLPKIKGAVCAQYRGYNGKRLGPYYFLMWREDGKLRKRYIKRVDLAATMAACAAYRAEQQEQRRNHAEVRQWIKDYNREFRHLEDLLRLAGMLR